MPYKCFWLGQVIPILSDINDCHQCWKNKKIRKTCEVWMDEQKWKKEHRWRFRIRKRISKLISW